MLSLLVGCRHSPKEYESKVTINRIEVVMKNGDGKPAAMDVEINYADCPGDQIEIVRGGKDFAECILGKYKPEDRVQAKVYWYWDSRGFYKWEVRKLGECERIIDPEDEVSYEIVEECEDYIVYGNKVGFRCKRVATSELIQTCPWFRRK